MIATTMQQQQQWQQPSTNTWIYRNKHAITTHLPQPAAILTSNNIGRLHGP
jgi:predicted alpha/beta hydrolase family esterase